MAGPGGAPCHVGRLIEPDRRKALADVMVAGKGEPGCGQALLLARSEGEVITIARPVERKIAGVNDEVWRVGAHQINEHVPVVEKVRALARDVRVGHLHDTDRLVGHCRPFPSGHASCGAMATGFRIGSTGEGERRFQGF